jgi:hypothetical protein
MKRIRFILFICAFLAFCAIPFFAQADGNYTIYYKISSSGGPASLQTVPGIDEYGDEVGLFTVPDMPDYTDKLCWTIYSVRFVNDEPRTNQVLGWCYPGDKPEVGMDLYLVPESEGVKTFNIYIGYDDADGWKETLWSHTTPSQGTYAPNRRWQFLYFYSPEKGENVGMELPQGKPYDNLYWDFWIVPPDNHDVTSDDAIRVGRLEAGDGFGIGEDYKDFYGRYWKNFPEWDENFDKNTSFLGYDMLLVPVLRGVDPENDARSEYRLFYDDKNNVQHELPVYYSSEMEMDYYIVPSPKDLGLEKDKYGRKFDFWTLYEASSSGGRYQYDDTWGYDEYVFDSIGSVSHISGNYYLVPEYSGDPVDDPDDPELDDCEWGIWYGCGDYYNEYYVYGMQNGNFIFECGDWADSGMTSVEIYLPSEVDPEEIQIPDGKMLTGWNVYGPVVYVEGGNEETETDDSLETGVFLDTFLPGERLVFSTGYDLFIEPVWEDIPDTAPECSGLSGIISGNNLGYTITARSAGHVRIIAARYTRDGRFDAIKILDTALLNGENRAESVFENFISDGFTYKIIVTPLDSLAPLCNCWNG